MTKEIYLKKLGKQLKNFPTDEKNDILNYYEEYIQEIESKGELMKQLPHPKELGKSLKKGIESCDQFDILEVTQNKQNFVTLGTCSSAKKQLLFLLLYTVVVTAIYHFMQALFHHSDILTNHENGSAGTIILATWLMMVLGFECSLYFALKKQWFSPLKNGFQLYYYIRLLVPALILIGVLKETHLPYAFAPVTHFLDTLDLSTLLSRFLAYQLWDYLTLQFPVYFYFTMAIAVLLPLNFIYQKKGLVLVS